MTLLEMVVSIALVAIIFAVVVPQFRSIQNNWDSKRGSAEGLQNARILMDHISSSISKAVRITGVSDSSEINGYIEFEDNDGATQRYELSSSYVQFGTPQDLSDLAGPVDRLQFTCYDACDLDTPLPSPIDVNEIRSVRVQAKILNSSDRGRDKNLHTHAYLRTNGNIGQASSLVGWWRLNETFGTTAADSSRYGNDGTLSNMTGAEWIGGALDGALSFDGGNDYIDCGSDSSLDVAGDVTVTAWLCARDFGTAPDIVTKGTYDQSYSLWLNWHRRVVFATNSDWLTSSSRLEPDTWYHVAATRDGNTRTIYIDGLQDASDTYSSAIGTTSSPLTISSSAYTFDGVIDDVHIYNRALSADEIYQMANWWKLSAGPGLEFNTSEGENPALIKIDTAHYLCAYEGPNDDGWAVVLTVDTGDWTISKETAYEFDNSKGNWPALARIDSNHYLCAYEGPNDDGWAVVLIIDPANWTISSGTAFEYEASEGKRPALAQIDLDNYLCAYEGPGDGCTSGWAVVLTVDANDWSVSKRPAYRYVTAAHHRDAGAGPALAKIDSTHFLCVYEGPDDDGWAVVLNVDLNGTSGPDATTAWWKLDETFGTTATDSSGSGNNGTLVGMSGSAWTTGIIDGALRFDGSDDRVDVGTFDIIGGSGLTIAAWLKADDFDVDDARIISKATGTSNNDHYWMLSTKRGDGVRLRFRLKTNGSTKTLMADAGNLSPGAWAHAAAVWNGSTMRLYEDGVLVGSASKSGTLSTSGTVGVAIGNQPVGAGDKPFDGLIDDVRIYNRALNEQEIAVLARKCITSETPYEFDGARGRNPALAPIDAAHYLCAYQSSGDDGWAVVLNVDTSAWTISRTGAFEFDGSKGEYPALAQIIPSRYLCAYEGDSDDGWAVILAVDTDDWTIWRSAPFEYDGSKGKYPALAQIDTAHYLCAYEGNNDDGWSTVLSIGTGSDPADARGGEQILP